MKKVIGLMVIAVVAMFFAAGCGNDTAKKGPVYPACESNADCKAKGEFCYNKICSECAEDANCTAACTQCTEGKCEGTPNCCTADADCPEGQRCKAAPGQKEGTCEIQ